MKKDTKDILWEILQETNDEKVSDLLLNLMGYKETPDKLTYDDLFGRKLVSPVEQEYQKEKPFLVIYSNSMLYIYSKQHI